MTDDAAGTGSFLDTGIDFTRDEWDPEEKAAMLEWYAEMHDYEGLDLAPFAPFWIERDPGGFKRLRRHLLTLEEERDGTALPVAAGVLMYTHTYTAIGNGKGAFYEIIAARALGATRAEILEVVRLASLFGGPVGLNPIAAIVGDYFEQWVEDGADRIEWPVGWAPDPDAFRTGIDHSTNDLTPAELDLVRDWHRRMHGEVPAHIDRLVELHPTAYKTLRIREETVITGELPTQLVPLLVLHLAVVRGRRRMLRRAVSMAAALGVRRHHVVCALYWASVAGGERVLEEAFEAVADLLETLD